MIRVVPLLEAAQATELAATAIGFATLGRLPRVYRPVGKSAGTSDMGEGRRGWTADAPTAIALMPDLKAVYGVVQGVMRQMEPTWLPSPWDRSRFTLKVYGPSDWQGLHRDTNTRTALLVLAGDCSPEFPANGRYVAACQPGDLLLFDGHTNAHRVPPQSGWRVTMPVNLYLEGQMFRPDYADALVYGA